MKHETIVTSLLEGLGSPEDVRRRLEAVWGARRQEEDGEYLDGTFSLCRRACDKLDSAAATLGDARAVLEELLSGNIRSTEDFRAEDLIKAMSSAKARISSIVRGFRKLEDAMGRHREDDRGRLDKSAELLRQACTMMAEASVMVGDAQKLAKITDRRARSGPGSRLRLSRRLRSRELLKAVSSVQGSLLHIVRTARTVADVHEGPVRDVVNSDSVFE